MLFKLDKICEDHLKREFDTLLGEKNKNSSIFRSLSCKYTHGIKTEKGEIETIFKQSKTQIKIIYTRSDGSKKDSKKTEKNGDVPEKGGSKKDSFLISAIDQCQVEITGSGNEKSSVTMKLRDCSFSIIFKEGDDLSKMHALYDALNCFFHPGWINSDCLTGNTEAVKGKLMGLYQHILLTARYSKINMVLISGKEEGRRNKFYRLTSIKQRKHRIHIPKSDPVYEYFEAFYEADQKMLNSRFLKANVKATHLSNHFDFLFDCLYPSIYLKDVLIFRNEAQSSTILNPSYRTIMPDKGSLKVFHIDLDNRYKELDNLSENVRTCLRARKPVHRQMLENTKGGVSGDTNQRDSKYAFTDSYDYQVWYRNQNSSSSSKPDTVKLHNHASHDPSAQQIQRMTLCVDSSLEMGRTGKVFPNSYVSVTNYSNLQLNQPGAVGLQQSPNSSFVPQQNILCTDDASYPRFGQRRERRASDFASTGTLLDANHSRVSPSPVSLHTCTPSHLVSHHALRTQPPLENSNIHVMAGSLASGQYVSQRPQSPDVSQLQVASLQSQPIWYRGSATPDIQRNQFIPPSSMAPDPQNRRVSGAAEQQQNYPTLQSHYPTAQHITNTNQPPQTVAHAQNAYQAPQMAGQLQGHNQPVSLASHTPGVAQPVSAVSYIHNINQAVPITSYQADHRSGQNFPVNSNAAATTSSSQQQYSRRPSTPDKSQTQMLASPSQSYYYNVSQTPQRQCLQNPTEARHQLHTQSTNSLQQFRSVQPGDRNHQYPP